MSIDIANQRRQDLPDPGTPAWQHEVNAAIRRLVDGHDRDDRVAACQLLARLGGGQTFLEDATTDGSPHVRAAAVDALAGFSDIDADRWILPRLDDVNPYVRQAAVRAVRRLRLRQATPTVLRLAEDPNRFTRGAALRALGTLGEPEATRLLLGALNHPTTYIRGKAARALADIAAGTPDEPDKLRKRLEMELELWLRQPSSPDVGHGLADALGALADRRSVPLLCRVLREGVGARHNAAEALGRIGDEQARPALEEALNDPSRALRRSATRALVALGIGGSLDAFNRLLSDRDTDVLLPALEAIGGSGDARLLPKVLDVAFGPIAFTRTTALRAAAQLDPAGATDLWLRCLSDTNPHVRSLAVDMLAADADDPRVADALTAAVADEPVKRLAHRLDAVGQAAAAHSPGRPTSHTTETDVPCVARWPEPDPSDAAYAAVYHHVVNALDRLPDDATVGDLDKATASALDDIIEVATRLRSMH